MSVTFLTDTDKSELRTEIAERSLDNIHFEQGSITSNTGEFTNGTNRLRSVDFIRVRGQEIAVPDGYDILGVLYYDENFAYKTGGTKKTQSVVLDGDYPWAKITVRRTDDTNITPLDIVTHLSQYNANQRLHTVELESVLFEQGSILNATGFPTSNDKRIRTATFLKCEGQLLAVPDGFKIVNAYFYDNSKNYVGHSQLNRASAVLTHTNPAAAYAKLIIAKNDTDATIHPEDIKRNTSLEFLRESISSDSGNRDLAEYINMLMLDNIQFEPGSIISYDGRLNDVTDRIRSRDFIRVRGQSISVPDGYAVLGVIYYDEKFVWAHGIVNNTQVVQTVVLDGNYPWAKITVCTADNLDSSKKTPITPQEVNTIHKDTSMLVKNGVRITPIPDGLEYKPVPYNSNVDAMSYSIFDHDLYFGDGDKEEKDSDPIPNSLVSECGMISVNEFYETLFKLVDDNTNYLERTLLGKDQSNTYDIWEIKTKVSEYVSTSMIGTGEDATYTNNVSSDHIPTILLVAGVHGFEKSSVYSVYFFLRDLINRWQEDPVLEYLRWHVNFKIIPVANPWGFDHNMYVNSENINFNRSFPLGHVPNQSGTANGGSEPYDKCKEAELVGGWIDSNPNALMLIDFHTTGGDIKHNMVSYHHLIEGYIINRIKLASREHINYVNQRYEPYYDCGFNNKDYQYLQVSPPMGRCYAYCQTKGIYGQIMEVGCNLPGEHVLYTPKCLEANTRTLGQWLYILLRTMGDIYKEYGVV